MLKTDIFNLGLSINTSHKQNIKQVGKVLLSAKKQFSKAL